MKLLGVGEQRCEINVAKTRRKGARRQEDVGELHMAVLGSALISWGRTESPTDSRKKGNVHPIVSMTGGVVTTMGVAAATLGRCCEAWRGTRPWWNDLGGCEGGRGKHWGFRASRDWERSRLLGTRKSEASSFLIG